MSQSFRPHLAVMGQLECGRCQTGPKWQFYRFSPSAAMPGRFSAGDLGNIFLACCYNCAFIFSLNIFYPFCEWKDYQIKGFKCQEVLLYTCMTMKTYCLVFKIIEIERLYFIVTFWFFLFNQLKITHKTRCSLFM